MSLSNHDIATDLVVVGGGLAGVCAAVAAARNGARVALLQNRPVLGGNASSEVGLLVASADRDFRHARETGILEEINLHNRYRNHEVLYNNYNMDLVLWTLVREAGVDLYLNTNVDGLEMAKENRIASITGTQLGTEKRFRFKAPLFVDSSGDGILLGLSGGLHRRGREARREFGESRSPEEACDVTQGSTLMFRTKNLGRPVRFVRPTWAHHFPNKDDFPHPIKRTEGGFLWIEYGAKMDTIADNEAIRDELMKILYGVWDHLKNHGDYGMDNEELAWVATWPGKRESRRAVGDYIMTQKDLEDPTEYDDAVAYGGWPCDVHNPEGFWAKEKWLNYLYLPKPYPIPYRCYYSKNISNLFVAGRLTSASHVAHGSTRVMATCAVGGQAVGTAAALCLNHDLSPRALGRERIGELQQQLLKDDCHIPGKGNEDPLDLARKATVSAASEYGGPESEQYLARNVISGVSRGREGNENMWMSAPIHKYGPWELTLSWPEEVSIGSVQLTFDTMIREQRFFDKPYLGALPTCVRDYTVLAQRGENDWDSVARVTGNYLRHNILNFARTKTRGLRIRVDATNGDALARMYEVRAYCDSANATT